MRLLESRAPFILGISAAPASIAVSEGLLFAAALFRLAQCVRGRAPLRPARLVWLWLAWFGLVLVAWAFSPEPDLGWSEIRHVLWMGAVIITAPALDRASDRLAAWQGVFLVGALSSLVLIGEFIHRLVVFNDEIAAGGEAGFYLRSGGLLHHWMVYATVEIVVVAGLLSFWFAYPEKRRQWSIVAAIHGAAVLLSLTRMLWVACLLLAGIALAWRRPMWVLAVPLLASGVYIGAPDGVRLRISESFDMSHYSNSERLQMLQVGWRMARDNPLTGVGPGRVEKLYTSYLAPKDSVPAYHGHLHNNIVQIAAQFGLPVALAGCVLAGVLFKDLLRARRRAANRDEQFIAETALLALTGFVFAGLFEYTYGHSLGVIMLAFAVAPAFCPHPEGVANTGRHGGAVGAVYDRAGV